MTGNNYITQTQLAERWQVAESTRERWRSEGYGPIYMKILGRVRYRLSNITDFDEESLCGSTSQLATVRSNRQSFKATLRILAEPLWLLRTPEGYQGTLRAIAKMVEPTGISQRRACRPGAPSRRRAVLAETPLEPRVRKSST
jgi:hypothetical protein